MAALGSALKPVNVDSLIRLVVGLSVFNASCGLYGGRERPADFRITDAHVRLMGRESNEASTLVALDTKFQTSCYSVDG